VGLRMNRLFSWAMVFTLLVNVFALAFFVQPAQATGTIYIRADGSIDPPTAPMRRNGNVYTLTNDILGSIVVERNNVVIDGNDYTLQSSGAWVGTGVDLSGRQNVIVLNTQIKAFDIGVLLNSSSYNSISGNRVTNDHSGVDLGSSSNYNSISGNNITNNEYGISLGGSSGNSISGNNITANDYFGISITSCSNTSISGNKLANDYFGISITSCSNTSISGNKLANDYFGISITSCSNTNINGNYIANSSTLGITIAFSPNNRIEGNNIANNLHGGIELDYSSSNSINENNIADNGRKGIYLGRSSSSRIFHNSFVGNPHGVVSEESVNTWDDGYPSGGNYWSDYTTRYPSASQIDASSIWNTPYAIDASNTDHYPLMSQPVIPEFQPFLPLSVLMSVMLRSHAREYDSLNSTHAQYLQNHSYTNVEYSDLQASLTQATNLGNILMVAVAALVLALGVSIAFFARARKTRIKQL